MKSLNKTASLVFALLTSGMDKVGGFRRINNAEGTFAPLYIEIVGKRDDGKLLVVSMAHYYEQNGDMMRDPEMIFIWLPEQQMAFPVTYRQDGLGIDQQAVTEFDESQGSYSGVRLNMQAQQATFANVWMKNIKQQQRIAV